MNITKALFLLLLSVVTGSTMQAQVPNRTGDYYLRADGKSGATLKTAMHHIIKAPRVVSYGALLEKYQTTDTREDGTIWDMYSNITNYDPIRDADGHYKKEGDMYNREHSIPQSWFGKASPMRSDLYHVYPTDGYVNNRRSSYPMGENNGEKYRSANGFSKLGISTTPGYRGIVFEPADEFKGDFARTYFYMVTCYENVCTNWGHDVFSSSTYPGLEKWTLEMFLKWAKQDPVSEKEIKRNNAVAKIQHNRNPFIDYPGLEQYIWGGDKDKPFSYDHYVQPTGGYNPTPLPDENNDTDRGSNVNNTTGQYIKVTSQEQFKEDGIYIIAYEEKSMALAKQDSKSRTFVEVSIQNNMITLDDHAEAKPSLVKISKKDSHYVIKDMQTGEYLTLTTDKNELKSTPDANDQSVLWDIYIQGGNAEIRSVAFPNRKICFNDASPRFACYKTGMKLIALFLGTETQGIDNIHLENPDKNQSVYGIDGRKIHINSGDWENIKNQLPKGIYIIGKKKYIVR